MNELQVFNNEEFGQVRTTIIDGEPWFIGLDVANALGYKRARDAISTHVHEDDKLRRCFTASGQSREMTIINESGMYSLIFGSKLPSANQFKHWVTSEVLPTIRKTGGYVSNDDWFIQTYLPFADDGTTLMFRATLTTMRNLNKQLEEQKPLVEFAKTVQSTANNILVRECSKLASNYIGVDIGEKRLYQKLRDWKLVLTSKNEPSQMAYDLGVLELTERAGTKNGNAYVAYTTKVTPKGQVYIINRLMKECEG